MKTNDTKFTVIYFIVYCLITSLIALTGSADYFFIFHFVFNIVAMQVFQKKYNNINPFSINPRTTAPRVLYMYALPIVGSFLLQIYSGLIVISAALIIALYLITKKRPLTTIIAPNSWTGSSTYPNSFNNPHHRHTFSNYSDFTHSPRHSHNPGNIFYKR